LCTIAFLLSAIIKFAFVIFQSLFFVVEKKDVVGVPNKMSVCHWCVERM
jgi:hypothetical protein